MLSFVAVAFVLGGLLPTSRTAQAAGMALFYPMLFLSGAAIPREIMPDAVQRVAEALPLTQAVILLEDLWFGRGWNITALLALVAMLAVGSLVSVRTFHWE